LVKYSADLEAQVRNTQAQVAQLLDANQKLMLNQGIYIAKKSDPVDAALGKYLNAYPEKEKMKILFLRQSEGIYQFGQKRVFIKIDKGG